MHPSSTSAVRLLAAWQQQRRALTDRLDGLLLHGPTAVSRVADRADELRAALEAERTAFETFVAGAHDRSTWTVSLPEESAAATYPPLRSVPER